MNPLPPDQVAARVATALGAPMTEQEYADAEEWKCPFCASRNLTTTDSLNQSGTIV